MPIFLLSLYRAYAKESFLWPYFPFGLFARLWTAAVDLSKCPTFTKQRENKIPHRIKNSPYSSKRIHSPEVICAFCSRSAARWEARAGNETWCFDTVCKQDTFGHLFVP